MHLSIYRYYNKFLSIFFQRSIAVIAAAYLFHLYKKHQVLEGEGAIAKYREVMGATDPKEAAAGTVRKLFAESKGSNSTHGSDSVAAADREIALNFRLDEIVG